MLSFVHSWFTPGANPVGVDFGTDCLRLAQVQKHGDEFRLVAATSAPVPDDIRHDPAARLAFFTRTLRDLWTRGNFRGRRAVLALPAASMYIQHLRLPRMDEESLKRAIPWEARGKLPIDPPQALIRHIVAGEVYADDQPRSEVILMAAHATFIEQFLSAAARARLEVIAMTVEPKAILDCFLNIYRRQTDVGVTNCFIDMGCSASRVVIAHGGQILFARSIPIGGAHFNQAVAAAFKISLEEAKKMRLDSAAAESEVRPPHDSQREEAAQHPPARGQRPVDQHSYAMAGADFASTECEQSSATDFAGSALRTVNSQAEATARGAEPRRHAKGYSPLSSGISQAAHPQRRSQDDPELAESAAAGDGQPSRLISALEPPLNQLIEELTLCRRYHESTFPDRPVKRLIFVGGEARQRGLCQHIARELEIGARIGDPLLRMGRTTDVGIESGIDRRLPQPAWAVALGLSMGPAVSLPNGPQASRSLP